LVDDDGDAGLGWWLVGQAADAVEESSVDVGTVAFDVSLSTRKGSLRVRGKGRDGGKLRELPLTRPELRTALTNWLDQRPSWPHAQDSPALLLNRRGGRLSDRAARTIITDLGEHVGLGADTPAGSRFGPHALRHTFATQLLRGGADPVLVADLLGHAGLDTLRTYTQPADADRERVRRCQDLAMDKPRKMPTMNPAAPAPIVAQVPAWTGVIRSPPVWWRSGPGSWWRR